jgi:hypothetical protein
MWPLTSTRSNSEQHAKLDRRIERRWRWQQPLALIGAMLFVVSGVYDISATVQHTKARLLVGRNRDATLGAAPRAGKRNNRIRPVPSLLIVALPFIATDACNATADRATPPKNAALGMTPVPANLIPTTRQLDRGQNLLGSEEWDQDDRHACLAVSA